MEATSPLELFDAALDFADVRVRGIGDEQWSLPTPCVEWDVRSLLNHLVSDLRQVVPLLEGAAGRDVRDGLWGNLLGEDAQSAWGAARDEARAALGRPGALERGVDLGVGEFPAVELAWLLVTELVVHGWDIAVAIGASTAIPDALAEASHRKLLPQRGLLELSGLYGSPLELGSEVPIQQRLLALTGRRWI